MVGRRLAPVCFVLLLAAPLAAQQRGILPDDYYRMTFVGDVAVAPGGEYVAFTVTTVDEEKNSRSRSVWMAPLSDGEPDGPPFRFTDATVDSWAPVWAPDGGSIAFQSRRGDETGIWFARVGAPGGEAYRVAGVDATPIWSPDEQRVAFVADGGGEDDREERRGWVAPDAISNTVDADRFDGHVITDMDYRRDGTASLLPHPDARPKRQIHVVSSDGGDAVQVTDEPFDVREVSWSQDGAWLFFTGDEVGDRFGSNDHIYVAPGAGGEARRVSAGEGSYRSPVVSPDGRRLAFVFSAGPADPTDLMVVDLAGDMSFSGEPTNLTPSWDLQPGSPRWEPDGGSIRFEAGAYGNRHVFEISADGGEVRQVTEGDRQLGSISTSRDGRVMAYTSTTPVAPAEVFVSRADGSAEHRISSFNDAWLADVSLMPADRVTWEVSDGTQIEGWLIAPVGYEPGQGKHPLILKAHGGPNGMYGNTFFQAFHVLSASGFFVLYPNPRGSSGYGEDFMHAIRGQWGLVDEEDFLTGIDTVLDLVSDIDPDLIGVAGGSYGGYVTNWLTARSDRFAAAVTSRSIVSLETLYGTTDSGSLEYHFFGPPWEERERYRQASPWTYVQNVTAPTLIIHSENDYRTPMQDGEMWFMALKRQGVPVEFVRYPRSSHGLSRSGEPWLLVDRLERQRSWFEHWLIDAPPRTDGQEGSNWR